MRSFVYAALFTPHAQDGGFVVTFPDVPEAVTQGEDAPDTLQQAADCLEEAIAGRIRRGTCLPEASPVGPGHFPFPVPLPARTAAKAALYSVIHDAGLTLGEIAVHLRCDEEELGHLLDPRHASELSRLEAALAALGQQLVVGVQASGVAE